MDSTTDTVSNPDIDSVSSLAPVELPGQQATVSVEDRLNYVEEILKIK